MRSNIRMFLCTYMIVLTCAVIQPSAAANNDLLSSCLDWSNRATRGQVAESCVALLDSPSEYGSGNTALVVRMFTVVTDHYLDLGDFRKAEKAALLAARIAGSRLAQTDPLYIIASIRLATVYLRQERYEEAEKLNRDALDVAPKSLVGEAQELANAHENLAMLELVHGRYDAAIPLLRRVLQIRNAQEGAMPVSVGATFLALASALEKQGQVVEAIRYYEQASEWFRSQYGPLSPQVANCILNSARVLGTSGQLKQAEIVYQYAFSILKQNPETPQPYLARAHTELGLLHQALGEYSRAEDLLQTGLALREKSLGGNHPLVAESIHGLAVNRLLLGEVPTAIPLLWRAISILELGLRLPLSEARLSSLLDQQRTIEDSIYGGLLKFPASSELRQLAVTIALLRKGRSAEAGRRTNRSTHAAATTKAQTTRLADWKTSRAEYEQLILQGPGVLSPEDYRVRTNELRIRIEDLELGILSDTRLSDAQPVLEPKHIVAKVAAKITQNNFLLEIVLTHPLRPPANYLSAASESSRYLALILDSSGKIDAYDLGDATHIDRQISGFLVQLQDPGSRLRPVAQAIYQVLFSPLTATLPPTGRIYVSADGCLQLIPFAALHDGTSYLIERYQFIYLNAGRDLLEDDERVASGPPVIVADPEFAAAITANGDRPTSQNLKTQEEETLDRGTAGLYSMLSSVARLPGTRREAVLLSGLWPDAKLLMGRDATESAVRRVVAPLVLHLATHGVFLEDQRTAGAELGMQSARALVPLTGSATVKQNPETKPLALSGGSQTSALSRSALLLAGVQSAHQSRDRYHDGLLTADEVREMNLWGTNLVVLSACDSGRGAIRTGQGIYGLRRAFFSAGAETLVTSLWRVADVETSELMDEYYQRLSKGGTRIGSLGEAMAAIRKRHPHPYYWAPFIGIGRDAPLNVGATKLQANPREVPTGKEMAKSPPIDSPGASQERPGTQSASIGSPGRPSVPLTGSIVQIPDKNPYRSERAQVFLVGPPAIRLQANNLDRDMTGNPDEAMITCQQPCGHWILRRNELKIIDSETDKVKRINLDPLIGPQITIHYKIQHGRQSIRYVGGSILGTGIGSLFIGIILLAVTPRDPGFSYFSTGLGLTAGGIGWIATGGALLGTNRTRISIEQKQGSSIE